MRIFLTLLLAFNFPLSTWAMDVPVSVVAMGNDTLGKRLAYKIKEGINQSSSMHLTLQDEYGIKLYITSVDGSVSNNGKSSAYSVTWTCWINSAQPLPYYVRSVGGIFGRSRVDEVAEEIIAETLEHAEELEKLRQTTYE